MKAQPKSKKHFMAYRGEYDTRYGYERVSACGQVREYSKNRRPAGRELVTVNCGNCIRQLKGDPPAFPGKMVMLITAKEEKL